MVTKMDTDKTSLRSLVDKWIAPTATCPVRVTRFGRTTNGVRFVCMEALRLTGPLTIAFFHHDDGAWRVFPPSIHLFPMRAASKSNYAGEHVGFQYPPVGHLPNAQQ